MNSKQKWTHLGLMVLIFVLINNVEVFAQDKSDSQPCAGSQTWLTHRFRKEWESFEIDLRDNAPELEDCQVMSLELYWANGRNNGSLFSVTFVDATNRPIYTRALVGYLTGNIEFPLTATSNVESKPWLGTPWMIAVPASITIQAGHPFVPPANIQYRVVRVPRISKPKAKVEEPRKEEKGKPGNEIVRVRNAVRLIGSTRIAVVQIELKTSQPFPVRDAALQVRIGKKTFINELSGDYTGRTLTLSLTPEMFAELEDGAEVLAFFEKPDGGDAWNFGKLDKRKLDR